MMNYKDGEIEKRDIIESIKNEEGCEVVGFI